MFRRDHTILNKSWRQHPTKQQLYSHLLLITKTIKIKRPRHAGHSWRSRDELISDVLLWTPSHGWVKVGRPAWTYILLLCADKRDVALKTSRKQWTIGGWRRERVRDIRADSATGWWWWFSKYRHENKALLLEIKAD